MQDDFVSEIWKGHKKSIRNNSDALQNLKKTILAAYPYKECYNKKNKPK